jgi:hypothetical protein
MARWRATMRWSALAAVAAVASAASPARADGKDACFDAAEQAELARHQGDLMTAHKDLLVCAAGGSCPLAVRRDCTQWLGEVEAALPSIVIHARDGEGHDVVDARVLVDGAQVADRLTGTALPLNPGPHRIRLETATGGTYEEQIVAVEGQKDRLVEATISSHPSEGGSTTPPADAAPAAPASSERQASGRLWLVGGLAALGVVGLGFATGFEVAGQSQYGNMKNGCAKTGNCLPDDVSSTKQMLYVLAPMSFAVGVVALGAAGALWLLRGPAPPPTTGAGWTFDVATVSGLGAEGTVTGRF